MDEIKQRYIVKFLWKEGTDAHEIHQRLKAIYGDSSYPLLTINELMRNLTLERTEIRDFPRSGRPPIAQIDDDIMFLLSTFPFHTVHTPVETFGVSPSRILRHVRNSLGFNHYHFRWVPHELTSHLKEKRVVICRELLELLQIEETFGFARAITGMSYGCVSIPPILICSRCPTMSASFASTRR
jgi:hypothetical protein